MVVPLTPVRLKRHAARAYGRKIGIVCESLRLTYLEFNERCDRLSQALLKLGLKRGDRVAYLSFNCHRLLEAYYGVPQVGCILLPLNIRLSTEELNYVLNDAGPRVLFFDPEFIPRSKTCVTATVPSNTSSRCAARSRLGPTRSFTKSCWQAPSLARLIIAGLTKTASPNFFTPAGPRRTPKASC